MNIGGWLEKSASAMTKPKKPDIKQEKHIAHIQLATEIGKS